jgi:hypothetical protein
MIYHLCKLFPGETRQKLIDFRKNALDMRKKRDTDAPSRTSMLHAINEAKKHENALADMAYGEKKNIDESYGPEYCLLNTGQLLDTQARP